MTEGAEPFRSIVDRIPVGLALIESPGRIVWTNPAFAYEWPELARSEAPSLEALLPSLGLRAGDVRRALEASWAEGTSSRLRSLRDEPPGASTKQYLDLEVRPLPRADEQPARSLLVVTNATERMLEHRQARLFYESFLTSTNAIEVTDRNGILVDVNPAFERIYGYHRDELVGRRPNIVQSHQTPKELYARMWSDLLDPARGHWSGEIMNRDRYGKERPVFLTITAVRDEAGATTHYVGVAVDLTELRAWQRSASHAERLASVGQLAAGVAHEINTPLANVMLVAESLLRRSQDPWVRSRAETIAEQVEVAAKIVRGLLDFARRRDPEVQPLDLAPLVRSTVAFLRGKQSANVDLEEIYPEGPVRVRGDRGQLTQVLTNILNNAYEAMDGNGRIRVELRRTERTAEIEITDNGPGIPDDVIGHIFEPFFTTKPEGKGTGLGLAISHGILQAHQGSILARNAPDGGASFLLTLPLDTSPGDRPPATPAPAET